jgi:hypothetical protein
MRVGEMEGRARGAPLCKNIFFVSRFSLGREEERIEIGEESRDSIAVRAQTHCNQAFLINTIRAVFPACYSVYVHE